MDFVCYWCEVCRLFFVFYFVWLVWSDLNNLFLVVGIDLENEIMFRCFEFDYWIVYYSDF